MLLLIHLLFARGFISAHPGGRTTSLSKMDWGKTLSLEQPRAADLAFLSLFARPTQVQAVEQRQRSPSARFRPSHQVGKPELAPSHSRVQVSGLRGAPAVSAARVSVQTGWVRPAGLRGRGGGSGWCRDRSSQPLSRRRKVQSNKPVSSRLKGSGMCLSPC